MSGTIKKFIKHIKFISDKINYISEIICIILGISIVITLNLGVFSRYVLNHAFIWTEEAARFFMIWLAFIGGSMAVKKVELIHFEFFRNLLPEKATRYIDLCIYILIVIFCAAFIKGGFMSMPVFKLSIASATRISLFWPALGLIVGIIFTLIHICYFILEIIFL